MILATNDRIFQTSVWQIAFRMFCARLRLTDIIQCRIAELQYRRWQPEHAGADVDVTHYS